MTVMKTETAPSTSNAKGVSVVSAKRTTTKPTIKSRSVRFSIKPSPEIVGDKYLQSTDQRRRYMRRGSRSPNMLAIHAVRSSAEVAQIEAYDCQQEKLEQQAMRLKIHHHHQQHDACQPSTGSTNHSSSSPCSGPSTYYDRSLAHHIRRSMSFPATRKLPLPTDIVDTELARSLLQKTHLTDAQKRRLSLEILSRVEL